MTRVSERIIMKKKKIYQKTCCLRLQYTPIRIDPQLKGSQKHAAHNHGIGKGTIPGNVGRGDLKHHMLPTLDVNVNVLDMLKQFKGTLRQRRDVAASIQNHVFYLAQRHVLNLDGQYVDVGRKVRWLNPTQCHGRL